MNDSTKEVAFEIARGALVVTASVALTLSGIGGGTILIATLFGL